MTEPLLAGVAVRSIMPAPDAVDDSIRREMRARLDEPGSPLRVKALALTLGETSAVFIAADLCGSSTAFHEAVAEATGLDPCNVVVTASHTHSANMPAPPDGPHPFLDFVKRRMVDAALEAIRRRRPARIGYGVTHIAGASFNTQVDLPDGRSEFTRDFRKGLSTGRPIDPRINIIRIDDETGRPLAGWVRFAAHPACVIVDPPCSAEYPGYMTDRLTESTDGDPPFLFGYGASGDVNCIPMFGTEADARDLGHRLADHVAPVFEAIRTRPARRFVTGHRAVGLPIDPAPSVQDLDREIEEIRAFQAALEDQPDLEWVIGINCKKDWSVEQKRAHVEPLAQWAILVKQRLAQGHTFPASWSRQVWAWVLDDLGLVFEAGETYVEISLALSARSPLRETLLISHTNGGDAYLGTDEARRRGGYEVVTSPRYALLAPGARPLPYALGAADAYLDQLLSLINDLNAC